jgi:hypothetical protein
MEVLVRASHAALAESRPVFRVDHGNMPPIRPP